MADETTEPVYVQAEALGRLREAAASAGMQVEAGDDQEDGTVKAWIHGPAAEPLFPEGYSPYTLRSRGGHL